MSETQDTIYAWQTETFGETTVWAAFERMQKEYWELRDACHRYDNLPITHGGGELVDPDGCDICDCMDKVRSELADVYITMCRIAGNLGVDIDEAVNEKMAINRDRKWAVGPDGNGQHVD